MKTDYRRLRNWRRTYHEYKMDYFIFLRT